MPKKTLIHARKEWYRQEDPDIFRKTQSYVKISGSIEKEPVIFVIYCSSRLILLLTKVLTFHNLIHEDKTKLKYSFIWTHYAINKLSIAHRKFNHLLFYYS